MAAQGPTASRNPALNTCIIAEQVVLTAGPRKRRVHPRLKPLQLVVLDQLQAQRMQLDAGVSRMQRDIWQASSIRPQHRSFPCHAQRMAGRQTVAPMRPRSSCRACLAQVHAAVGLGVDQGALQQAGSQHLRRAW